MSLNSVFCSWICCSGSYKSKEGTFFFLIFFLHISFCPFLSLLGWNPSKSFSVCLSVCPSVCDLPSPPSEVFAKAKPRMSGICQRRSPEEKKVYSKNISFQVRQEKKRRLHIKINLARDEGEVSPHLWGSDWICWCRVIHRTKKVGVLRECLL